VGACDGLASECPRQISLRARASQLGAMIRAEDGVGRAVEIIASHFG
jgi:hypothetical protein